MNPEDLQCTICKGGLTEGYLLDRTKGGYFVTPWIAGKPEKHWFYNLDVEDKELEPVIAYKCVECGHLELFVNPIV